MVVDDLMIREKRNSSTRGNEMLRVPKSIPEESKGLWFDKSKRRVISLIGVGRSQRLIKVGLFLLEKDHEATHLASGNQA